MMIRWPWEKTGKNRAASARQRPGAGGVPAPSTGQDAARARDNAEERRQAFERLAREHARELYGAALRLARNPDDAQDLAQDTLLRAFVAFESFTPGTNFRAWLLRILTNRYINLYRRRQRVAFLPWDELTDLNDGGPKAARGGAGDEPEAALLAGAMDGEIEAALSSLSEGVHLVILLVDVEQLSYEQAAAALAIPIGTVRSRLNRGREQMRAALHEYARARRLV